MALAFAIAAGAAGVLAQGPEKETKKPLVKSATDETSNRKKGSRKEDLETLKDLLAQFKELRWKYQEATRAKIEQEQALESLKKRSEAKRFFGQYFLRQQIVRQQERLHLTIEEREACAATILKTAGEIAKKAPAIRKTLAKWLKASEQSEKPEKSKMTAAAREKKIAEVKSLLLLLDKIVDKPSHAQQILILAFDKKDSLHNPENKPRPFGGWGHRGPGGGGAPRHRAGLEAKIKALEYEQENLYRQWLRNDNTLRALRKFQEDRLDKSDPGQPPLFPPRGKPDREDGWRENPPHGGKIPNQDSPRQRRNTPPLSKLPQANNT